MAKRTFERLAIRAKQITDTLDSMRDEHGNMPAYTGALVNQADIEMDHLERGFDIVFERLQHLAAMHAAGLIETTASNWN
jgi:hypothetical protein